MTRTKKIALHCATIAALALGALGAYQNCAPFQAAQLSANSAMNGNQGSLGNGDGQLGQPSGGDSQTSPTPLPQPTASGPQVFVSPTGSDSNPGTMEAPFKTIQKGINAAKPGYTVRVAPGVYNEAIMSKVSGTASARIRIVSDLKWGAKLKPSDSPESVWENSGSYVDIEDFEIDASLSPTTRFGFYAHGSHVNIRGNHVHDIHNKGSCTSQGAAGILGEGYYGDEDVNVIGNLIHDAGPPKCSFDHGIYHTGQGEISNNIVYRGSGAAIHMWHDPRHMLVANNTVSDSMFGVVLGGGDAYGTTDTPGDYITLANNIIVRCQTGVWAGGTLGNNNKFINNVLFGNSTDWSMPKGTPTGTINADPQFVAYQSGGGGDYHLKNGSPAIDKGDSSLATKVDFDGFARPSGGAPDIGAYESH